MTKRLEKLKQQKSQIEAQLQQIEAQAKEKQRKEDARRKIIAGALALEHAAIDTEFGQKLYGLLERYVTRPQERALFGLAPRQGTGQDNLKEEFRKQQPEPKNDGSGDKSES